MKRPGCVYIHESAWTVWNIDDVISVFRKTVLYHGLYLHNLCKCETTGFVQGEEYILLYQDIFKTDLRWFLLAFSSFSEQSNAFFFFFKTKYCTNKSRVFFFFVEISPQFVPLPISTQRPQLSRITRPSKWVTCFLDTWSQQSALFHTAAHAVA